MTKTEFTLTLAAVAVFATTSLAFPNEWLANAVSAGMAMFMSGFFFGQYAGMKHLS